MRGRRLLRLDDVLQVFDPLLVRPLGQPVSPDEERYVSALGSRRTRYLINGKVPNSWRFRTFSETPGRILHSAAAIGEHCMTYSGLGRRNEPHAERKYQAVQAIEEDYGSRGRQPAVTSLCPNRRKTQPAWKKVFTF